MSNVKAKIILKSGSQYDENFSNVFEMDQYFEDNKDTIKKIIPIEDLKND
jgi:ribosomal protein S17E